MRGIIIKNKRSEVEGIWKVKQPFGGSIETTLCISGNCGGMADCCAAVTEGGGY